MSLLVWGEDRPCFQTELSNNLLEVKDEPNDLEEFMETSPNNSTYLEKGDQELLDEFKKASNTFTGLFSNPSSSFDDFIARITALYEITAVHLLNGEFAFEENIGEIMIKLSLKTLGSNIHSDIFFHRKVVSESEKQCTTAEHSESPLDDAAAEEPRCTENFINREKVLKEFVLKESTIPHSLSEVQLFATEESNGRNYSRASSKNNRKKNIGTTSPSIIPKKSSSWKRRDNSDSFPIESGTALGKVFSCELCKKFNVKHNSLVRHHLENHIDINTLLSENEKDTIECDACSRQYMNHINLARHKLLKNCQRSFGSEIDPSNESNLSVVDSSVSEEDNQREINSENEGELQAVEVEFESVTGNELLESNLWNDDENSNNIEDASEVICKTDAGIPSSFGNYAMFEISNIDLRTKSEDGFCCTSCGKSFKVYKSIIRHYLKKHVDINALLSDAEKDSVKCDDCGRPCMTHFSLAWHKFLKKRCSQHTKPEIGHAEQTDSVKIFSNQTISQAKPSKRSRLDVHPGIEEEGQPRGLEEHHQSSDFKNESMSILEKVSAQSGSGFLCKSCGISFTVYNSLVRHHVKHHTDVAALLSVDEKVNKRCSVCQKPFISQFCLARHKILKQCYSEQQNSFKSNSLLVLKQKSKTKSIENYVKKTSIRCKICRKAFLNHRSLARHKFLRTCSRPVENASEVVCKTDAGNHAEFEKSNINLMTISEEGFCCKSCGKSYKIYKSMIGHYLNKHVDIHVLLSDNEKDSVKCDDCGRPCMTHLSLAWHKLLRRRCFRPATPEIEHADRTDSVEMFSNQTISQAEPSIRSRLDVHPGIEEEGQPRSLEGHRQSSDFKNESMSILEKVSSDLEKVGAKSGSGFLCKSCGISFTVYNSLVRHHVKRHTDVEALLSVDEKVNIRCSVCRKPFTSQFCLARHKILKQCYSKKSKTESVVNNVKKMSIRCKICRKAFLNHSSLARHKFLRKCSRPVENAYEVVCKTDAGIQSSFGNYAEFEKSNIDLMTKSEGGFYCKSCGKSYKIYKSMIRHYLEKHVDIHALLSDTEKDSIRCDDCGKPFMMHLSLAWHKLLRRRCRRKSEIENNVQKKSIRCRICRKAFSDNSSLARHKILRTCSRPDFLKPSVTQKNLCDLCGKSYVKLTGLYHHQSLIHNISNDQSQVEPTSQCPHCGEIFNRIKKYHAHMREHREEEYKCPFCDVEPFKKATLQSYHITKFHRPTKCGICGETCTGKIGYADHLKEMHPDTNAQVLLWSKKFRCKKCGSCFTSALLLEEHDMIKHQGRLLECEICNKKLKGIVCMRNHMRTHGVGVQHKCPACNRPFTCQSHMVTHIRIHHPDHLPEKYAANFPCPDCNKTFGVKHSLKKHWDTKHAGVIYHCTNCTKTFRSLSGLRNHKKTQCFKDE